jgi:hypothetical protein
VSYALVTTQSVPITEMIKSCDLFKSKEVKQLPLHNCYPNDDPLFKTNVDLTYLIALLDVPNVVQIFKCTTAKIIIDWSLR